MMLMPRRDDDAAATMPAAAAADDYAMPFDAAITHIAITPSAATQLRCHDAAFHAADAYDADIAAAMITSHITP